MRLHPCPFCGGEAVTDADKEDFDVARAFCKDCGSIGPWENLSDHPSVAAAKRRAGERWNERVEA